MRDDVALDAALREILADAATVHERSLCLDQIKDLLADDRAELARLRAALEELDALDPNDFKVGQNHLNPAFREVDLREVLRAVQRIVNRTLHGTDEHGRPLPIEETTHG